MAFHLSLWCFFIFCANIVEPTVTDNADIQNRICRSCERGGISTSCYCDNICDIYNDCCFDAPAETSKDAIQIDVRLSCLRLPFSFRQTVYVVDGCLSSWEGPANVRNKCEQPNDLSDMFISIPVTDTKTKITYRNRYCAECNRADPSSLSLFSLKLGCGKLLKEVNQSYRNITEDFMLQNLIYHDHAWGVYHWNQSGGGMSFLRCDFSLEIPAKLLHLVRSCESYVKSTCSNNWNDDLTQQLCISSNMNIVYDGHGTAYRNSYCAVCNYISVNETRCERHKFPATLPPMPNFLLLLDFSSVNDKPRCSSDEIYDSVVNKCRRLICAAPGEVAAYGKCTKKEK